jgi:hypothetical protein
VHHDLRLAAKIAENMDKKYSTWRRVTATTTDRLEDNESSSGEVGVEATSATEEEKLDPNPYLTAAQEHIALIETGAVSLTTVQRSKPESTAVVVSAVEAPVVNHDLPNGESTSSIHEETPNVADEQLNTLDDVSAYSRSEMADDEEKDELAEEEPQENATKTTTVADSEEAAVTTDDKNSKPSVVASVDTNGGHNHQSDMCNDELVLLNEDENLNLDMDESSMNDHSGNIYIYIIKHINSTK